MQPSVGKSSSLLCQCPLSRCWDRVVEKLLDLLGYVSQVMDAVHGGYGYFTFWLEVKQLALQYGGGKPGQVSVQKAQQLLTSLPHSALFARFV